MFKMAQLFDFRLKSHKFRLQLAAKRCGKPAVALFILPRVFWPCRPVDLTLIDIGCLHFSAVPVFCFVYISADWGFLKNS